MTAKGLGRTLPIQTDDDTGKVLVASDTAGPDGGASWAGVGTAAYTPAVTGDWTGTDPTTVQQALDRIAAALVAASHTP